MALNISIPSWAPPGETHAQLFIERTNIASLVVNGIFFGIFFCLYCFTMRQQLKAASPKWWQVIYLNALLVLSILYLTASTRWTQQMFIDYRNFHLDNTTTDPASTGPLGFYNLDYNTPMIVFGNAAYIGLNALSDGLVIYRCLLVYNMDVRVIVLPVLIFLAEIIAGIVTVWNNSLPEANFFGAKAHKLITAWIVLSMCLNIGLCILIALRLVSSRSRLAQAYGASHAARFTSAGAIAIESALLYSFVSLLTLIFYELPPSNVAVNFVNVLLPLLSQTMCIAPTLILLRVARRRAFGRNEARASVTGTAVELVDREREGTESRTGASMQDVKVAES